MQPSLHLAAPVIPAPALASLRPERLHAAVALIAMHKNIAFAHPGILSRASGGCGGATCRGLCVMSSTSRNGQPLLIAVGCACNCGGTAAPGI